MNVQLPYLERYNRMNSAFDITAVTRMSDADYRRPGRKTEAAYNATNPKYPYPDAARRIKGAYTFAGVNGMPRRQFYTDWTNARAAHRLRLSFG